jgi:hypothetical protein
MQAQLIFVEGAPSFNMPTFKDTQYVSSTTNTLCEGYNAISLTDSGFPRDLNMGGRKVFYAEEAGGHPGGTTFPTIALILGASSATTDPNTSTTVTGPTGQDLYEIDQPAFYPTIAQSRIRLSAVETLTRGELNDSDDPLSLGGVGIHPYSGFVANGYTGNPGGVFSALTAPPDMNFGHSDAVGGIGTPNSTITGISAAAGAVGGGGSLDSFASKGNIDPGPYFGKLVSQILGGLPLSGIIGPFVNPNGGPGIPTITDELDNSTGIRTVTYLLQAPLAPYTSSTNISFSPGTDDNPTSGNFNLTAVTSIPPSGASTYQVTGNIDPFTVDISVFSVPFESMTFTSSSGTKPNVVTQVGNVTFEGPLSFLNALEQFLEDLGGNGFTISVTPSGIMATFSISLPSISLGVVNIQGLGLSAGVNIPFLGGAMLVDFGFASQENPFVVTVMMFGGGGYFLAGFGLEGVESLTVSIQFDGQLALNLGVASGGITLSAGFTFSYESSSAEPPGSTSLTAFVELTGGVEVLGIINISLELDLTLTYASTGGQSYLSGTAEMIVEVPVFMFSIPVPLKVHKQFAGSSTSGGPELAEGSPPRTTAPYPAFGDVLTASNWSTYCSAFAG